MTKRRRLWVVELFTGKAWVLARFTYENRDLARRYAKTFRTFPRHRVVSYEPSR